MRTYGSLAEVERAGRRVRKLHASLRGVDPSNGPGDRLILPATRAARDQARAFQRALAARRLTAVP